jgi:outer membrane protein OmpA-like peptidoglycan-associated protein
MATLPSETEDKELAELRSLLLGTELNQLCRLQERLDDPQLRAEDISEVLPQAILSRAAQDDQLAVAMMPIVEDAIQTSVKRDPQTLVDAIFPVMGPAIRKAIYSALGAMMQSLNQALEQSLSVQGLRWRMEALRTGKAFAEVVLLHTLLYRVEQVFLIHKETGLMLQHIVAESVVTQDADMVSGMLKAIQDFVQDSFSVQKSDILEAMRVGELTVWVEQGPNAILAVVIRGNAPQELRAVQQHAIELIHFEQRDAFKTFEGDASPFEASRPHLESCLQAQYETEEKKTSPALWATLGILLFFLGIWAFFLIRDNWRWDTYLGRLNAERGIVVTSEGKRDGKYFVTGLRDPLSADPVAIMRGANIDSKDVESRWEPYYALYPEFILTRAGSILQAPDSVTLKFENGVLYATGSASKNWIDDARRLARAIPGITKFQDDLVVEDLESLKKDIEKRYILFVNNTTEFIPGQEEVLQDLAEKIQLLYGYVQSAKKNLRIDIVGHTDDMGSEQTNLPLSQKRAEKVLLTLVSKGIKEADLSAAGMASKEPLSSGTTERDREINRSVTLRIKMIDR